MHLLEFSTNQIKALHKFIGSASISTFEAAGFNESEREDVLEGFGVFRYEADEIALDEYNATIEDTTP